MAARPEHAERVRYALALVSWVALVLELVGWQMGLGRFASRLQIAAVCWNAAVAWQLEHLLELQFQS